MVVTVTKPDVSEAEIKFREKAFPDVKLIKNKNLLCTSCGASVKDLVIKGQPICHPFLDTLLCRKCFNFYGDGEFSVDEDGSDKYCRWCGQGGTLFLCSKCTGGFCKKCVKRNVSRSALADIEKDDWECYCCNTGPILEQRAQCWAAKQFALEQSKSSSSGSRRSTASKRQHEDDTDSGNERNNYENKKRTKKDGSGSDEGEDNSRSRKKRKKDSSSKNKKTNDKSQTENGERALKDRKSKLGEEEEDLSPQDKTEKQLISAITAKIIQCLGDCGKVTKEVHKKTMKIQVKLRKMAKSNSVNSINDIALKIPVMMQALVQTTQGIEKSFQEYYTDWKKKVDGGTNEPNTINDVNDTSGIDNCKLEEQDVEMKEAFLKANDVMLDELNKSLLNVEKAIDGTSAECSRIRENVSSLKEDNMKPADKELSSTTEETKNGDTLSDISEKIPNSSEQNFNEEESSDKGKNHTEEKSSNVSSSNTPKKDVENSVASSSPKKDKEEAATPSMPKKVDEDTSTTNTPKKDEGAEPSSTEKKDLDDKATASCTSQKSTDESRSSTPQENPKEEETCSSKDKPSIEKSPVNEEKSQAKTESDISAKEKVK